jgi:hypothetical protein
MSHRARQLSDEATGQVGELIALVSPLDRAGLQRPCPGREKLGDGSIGAFAQHTADNYRRIAAFAQTSDRMTASGTGHRMPKLLAALGHGRRDQRHDAAPGGHDASYAASAVDVGTLVEGLAASRDELGQIARLTDAQLAAVPPAGSFRFCDGQRTLEQVLAGLLKHQRHQLEALAAGVGAAPADTSAA